MSILFSQFVPFSPSRAVCTRIIALYVYCLFSAIGPSVPHLASFHMYVLMYDVFVFSLTSLCVTLSSSASQMAPFSHFLWLSNIPSIDVSHQYVICLWTSRLLPCPDYCHSAAVNVGAHRSLNYGFLRACAQ